MTFEDRLADRGRWRADRCSVAKVLDLFSTKTAFLVLRECFYGTTRFEDFVDRVGASAPAVSRALKQLETARCVTRVPYREAGARPREEYRLTAGGDDHLQGDRAPLSFVEADTGRPVRVCVTADSETPATRSGDIEVRARRRGSGAR